MTACVYFGALMVGAILAHHGSPWLAFGLGCLVLASHVVCRLIDVLDPVEQEAEEE